MAITTNLTGFQTFTLIDERIWNISFSSDNLQTKIPV